MNPQQNQPVYYQLSNPAPREVPEYTVTDTVYAWLSLLFAFLYCQALPVTKHPLGGFLLIIALYISGFVILRLKKVKITPVCIISAVTSLVIGSALLLTNAGFLIKLSLAYSLASYCFFIYAAFGNRIEDGFSNYIYLDFIKILFVCPFHSLSNIFPAISNKAAKKGSLLLVKCLVGIVIAIVPTSLVFLFLSYDSDFMKILDDIFTFDSYDVFRTMVSLFFTLPLAMYGFGLYDASLRKTQKDKMTLERCNAGLQKAKIMPQLTAMVAVLPILFLYVVFFISQWKYYVSGFTGVLPENLSYAEYARKGFFELCAVSVINLIVIVVIAFFIKRNEKGSSVILRIIATVFCLCTLVLISTAVAKLVMYIDSYGLTPKRIYAMWLMVLIGLIFPIIAVSQFLRKPKTVALCLSVAIVMFAGLCVCNVNAMCAKYNTDMFLSGNLTTFDVDAMEQWGDSAIPSLVRVVNAVSEENNLKLKKKIETILQKKITQIEKEEFSIFAFSVPAAQAKAALEDYTPPAKPANSD